MHYVYLICQINVVKILLIYDKYLILVCEEIVLVLDLSTSVWLLKHNQSKSKYTILTKQHFITASLLYINYYISQ